MLSFSKLFCLLFLCGLLTLTSCKKDNSLTKATDVDALSVLDAVAGDASAAVQFDDVFNITMGVQASDAGEELGIGTAAGVIYKPASPVGTSSPDTVSRCFTVSAVPKIAHQFPKVVSVDFGAGCQGKDGKIRKGKIVTVYTGPMFISGSTASVSFVDYYVDSFKIEGTERIENTSSSNTRGWTVKIVNGKITNSQNGRWYQWDAVKEHKQTEGNGTPWYLADDVFEITGNATGSDSNNNSWTSLVTEPLTKKFSCAWIAKGKVQITRNSNNNTAILDYGNGTCDDKATIKYKEIIYNISL